MDQLRDDLKLLLEGHGINIDNLFDQLSSVKKIKQRMSKTERNVLDFQNRIFTLEQERDTLQEQLLRGVSPSVVLEVERRQNTQLKVDFLERLNSQSTNRIEELEHLKDSLYRQLTETKNSEALFCSVDGELAVVKEEVEKLRKHNRELEENEEVLRENWRRVADVDCSHIHLLEDKVRALGAKNHRLKARLGAFEESQSNSSFALEASLSQESILAMFKDGVDCPVMSNLPAQLEGDDCETCDPRIVVMRLQCQLSLLAEQKDTKIAGLQEKLDDVREVEIKLSETVVEMEMMERELRAKLSLYENSQVTVEKMMMYQDKIKELRTSQESLIDHLEDMESQETTLQEKLDETESLLKSKIVTLEVEAVRLKQREHKNNARIRDLEKQGSQMSEKLTKWEDKENNLYIRISNLLDQIKEQKGVISRQRGHFQEKEDYRDRVSILEANLSQVENGYREKVKRLEVMDVDNVALLFKERGDHERACLQLKEYEQKLLESNQALSQQREMVLASEQVNTSSKEAACEKLSLLQESFFQREQEHLMTISSLDTTTRELELSNSKLSEELHHSKSSIVLLEDDLSSLEMTINDITSQCTEKDGRLAHVECELSQKDFQIQGLTNDFTAKCLALQQKEKDVNECNHLFLEWKHRFYGMECSNNIHIPDSDEGFSRKCFAPVSAENLHTTVDIEVNSVSASNSQYHEAEWQLKHLERFVPMTNQERSQSSKPQIENIIDFVDMKGDDWVEKAVCFGQHEVDMGNNVASLENHIYPDCIFHQQQINQPDDFMGSEDVLNPEIKCELTEQNFPLLSELGVQIDDHRQETQADQMIGQQFDLGHLHICPQHVDERDELVLHVSALRVEGWWLEVIYSMESQLTFITRQFDSSHISQEEFLRLKLKIICLLFESICMIADNLKSGDQLRSSSLDLDAKNVSLAQNLDSVSPESEVCKSLDEDISDVFDTKENDILVFDHRLHWLIGNSNHIFAAVIRLQAELSKLCSKKKNFQPGNFCSSEIPGYLGMENNMSHAEEDIHMDQRMSYINNIRHARPQCLFSDNTSDVCVQYNRTAALNSSKGCHLRSSDLLNCHLRSGIGSILPEIDSLIHDADLSKRCSVSANSGRGQLITFGDQCHKCEELAMHERGLLEQVADIEKTVIVPLEVDNIELQVEISMLKKHVKELHAQLDRQELAAVEDAGKIDSLQRSVDDLQLCRAECEMKLDAVVQELCEKEAILDALQNRLTGMGFPVDELESDFLKHMGLKNICCGDTTESIDTRTSLSNVGVESVEDDAMIQDEFFENETAESLCLFTTVDCGEKHRHLSSESVSIGRHNHELCDAHTQTYHRISLKDLDSGYGSPSREFSCHSIPVKQADLLSRIQELELTNRDLHARLQEAAVSESHQQNLTHKINSLEQSEEQLLCRINSLVQSEEKLMPEIHFLKQMNENLMQRMHLLEQSEGKLMEKIISLEQAKKEQMQKIISLEQAKKEQMEKIKCLEKEREGMKQKILSLEQSGERLMHEAYCLEQTNEGPMRMVMETEVPFRGHKEVILNHTDTSYNRPLKSTVLTDHVQLEDVHGVEIDDADWKKQVNTSQCEGEDLGVAFFHLSLSGSDTIDGQRTVNFSPESLSDRNKVSPHFHTHTDDVCEGLTSEVLARGGNLQGTDNIPRGHGVCGNFVYVCEQSQSLPCSRDGFLSLCSEQSLPSKRQRAAGLTVSDFHGAGPFSAARPHMEMPCNVREPVTDFHLSDDRVRRTSGPSTLSFLSSAYPDEPFDKGHDSADSPSFCSTSCGTYWLFCAECAWWLFSYLLSSNGSVPENDGLLIGNALLPKTDDVAMGTPARTLTAEDFSQNLVRMLQNYSVADLKRKMATLKRGVHGGCSAVSLCRSVMDVLTIYVAWREIITDQLVADCVYSSSQAVNGCDLGGATDHLDVRHEVDVTVLNCQSEEQSENHRVITTETCHKLPPPSTVDTIFHADDVIPDVKASIVMLERQECLLQLRIKELESSENILHQRLTEAEVDREHINRLACQDKTVIHEQNVKIRELDLQESSLQARLSELEDSERSLYKHCLSLEGNASQMEDRIHEKEVIEKRLRDLILKLKLDEELWLRRSDDLAAHLEQLSSENTTLRQTVHELQVDNGRLEGSVSCKLQRICELENDESSMVKRLHAAEFAVLKVQSLVSQLENSKSAECSKVSKIEAINQDLSIRLERAVEENSVLSQHVSRQQGHLQAVDLRLAAAVDAEVALKQQLESVQKNEGILQKKVQSCDLAVIDGDMRVRELEQAEEMLRDRINHLQRSEARLKSRVDELESVGFRSGVTCAQLASPNVGVNPRTACPRVEDYVLVHDLSSKTHRLVSPSSSFSPSSKTSSRQEEQCVCLTLGPECDKSSLEPYAECQLISKRKPTISHSTDFPSDSTNIYTKAMSPVSVFQGTAFTQSNLARGNSNRSTCSPCKGGSCNPQNSCLCKSDSFYLPSSGPSVADSSDDDEAPPLPSTCPPDCQITAVGSLPLSGIEMLEHGSDKTFIKGKSFTDDSTQKQSLVELPAHQRNIETGDQYECQTSSVVLRMQDQMKLLKQDVLSAAHVDRDTSAILTSVQAELEVKDKELITTHLELRHEQEKCVRWHKELCAVEEMRRNAVDSVRKLETEVVQLKDSEMLLNQTKAECQALHGKNGDLHEQIMELQQRLDVLQHTKHDLDNMYARNEELSDKWQRCLVSADSLAAEVTSLGVMCREKDDLLQRLLRHLQQSAGHFRSPCPGYAPHSDMFMRCTSQYNASRSASPDLNGAGSSDGDGEVDSAEVVVNLFNELQRSVLLSNQHPAESGVPPAIQPLPQTSATSVVHSNLAFTELSANFSHIQPIVPSPTQSTSYAKVPAIVQFVATSATLSANQPTVMSTAQPTIMSVVQATDTSIVQPTVVCTVRSSPICFLHLVTSPSCPSTLASCVTMNDHHPSPSYTSTLDHNSSVPIGQQTDVLKLHRKLVPEAPTDLRVEEASSRSLVLSWKPPTMDEQGHSNGTKVIGYRIYLNGRVCQQPHNPRLSNTRITGLQHHAHRPVFLALQTLAISGRGSAYAELVYGPRNSGSDPRLHTTVVGLPDAIYSSEPQSNKTGECG